MGLVEAAPLRVLEDALLDLPLAVGVEDRDPGGPLDPARLEGELDAPPDDVDEGPVVLLDLPAQAGELRQLGVLVRDASLGHGVILFTGGGGRRRPAARAKASSRVISSANWAGSSAWSPSESAASGHGWTSMMSPSAPAAIAA